MKLRLVIRSLDIRYTNHEQGEVWVEADDVFQLNEKIDHIMESLPLRSTVDAREAYAKLLGEKHAKQRPVDV